MSRKSLPFKMNRGQDPVFQKPQQLFQSMHPANSLKSSKRNQNMNKSAVLTDKLALRFRNQIPGYISAQKHKESSRQSKMSSQRPSGITMFSKIAGTSVVSSNLHSKSKFDILSRKSVSKGKEMRKFPIQILNILYRQGIRNYNPFINALNTLEKIEDQQISYIQKQYIKKVCFIGIAKKVLRNKKFAQCPEYSRTGVLIRTYMNKIIAQKLERKRNQEQVIIIESNPTALSFNPYKKPKQLQEYLSKRQYAQTIRSVNTIINNQYKKYKLRNCQFLNNSVTYFQMIMYILLTLLVFVLMIQTPASGSDIEKVSIVGILVIMGLGITLSWLECNKNVNKVQQSNSMIDVTCRKIQDYFQSINDDTLVWKVGQDFYWIQVHNIKVHKRKFYVNSDDFC